jgi:hypothetical protein
LDIEAALKDVSDPSNLNHVKKHEAIAISFAHAWRDSSNTMQLEDFCETLGGGEDCVATSMVALIKTANEAILRLRNTEYPINLSPEDELAIKYKKICWVCKKN